MSSLLLYNHQSNLFNKIKEFPVSETLIITPGPTDADLLRSNLPQNFIVSMAHFISLLSRKNLSGIKPEKKSSLLFLLGTLWKKNFSNNTFEEFEEFFQTFTEMRNNIRDDDAYISIASDFSRNETEKLLAAKDFLESLGVKDEAAVYKLLLEQSSLDIGYKVIILCGFKFLNSIQVDLFGELSKYYNFFITFPAEVYEKREDRDWISWLSFEDTVEIDAKSEIIGNVCVTTKDQLNKTLLEISREKNEVFLLNHDFGLSKVQILGDFTSGLKLNDDFFEGEISWVFRFFQEWVNVGKPIDDVLERIEESIRFEIGEKKYKKVKILSMLLEKFQSFKELSDAYQQVDQFTLNLVKKMISLDAPRVSLVTKSGKKTSRSKEAICYLSSSGNQCAVLSENFIESTSEFSLLGPQLLSKLSQVGVIKRKDLEKQYNIALLNDFLSYEGNTLVTYQNVLEKYRDDLNTLRVEASSPESKANNYLNKKVLNRIEKFSASKMQTYLDCPQKFKYQYLTDLLKENEIVEEISALEEGRIEHKLIERIVLDSIEDVSGYCNSYFRKVTNGKKLSFHEYEKVRLGIIKKVNNGVVFVREILTECKLENYYFEKEVNLESFIGFIDFFSESDESLVLLDFKRSKYSIPTQKKVLAFENIQLWSYLNKVSPKNKVLIGYVCLDNLKESTFYSQNWDGTGFRTRKIEVQALITKFNSFEEELVKKMKSDDVFLPRPSHEQVCQFCDLNNICEKQ